MADADPASPSTRERVFRTIERAANSVVLLVAMVSIVYLTWRGIGPKVFDAPSWFEASVFALLGAVALTLIAVMVAFVCVMRVALMVVVISAGEADLKRSDADLEASAHKFLLATSVFFALLVIWAVIHSFDLQFDALDRSLEGSNGQ